MLPPAAVAAPSSGGSWMALLAATTLGLSSASCVRAQVSAAHDLPVEDEAPYRLVVQSYAPESLNADGLPPEQARPLASAQRAVTAEELRRGVAVQMVQLNDEARRGRPRVVAWVERGHPDLEFDALRARPSAEAVIGFAELERDGDGMRQGESAARVILARRPRS